MAKKSDWATYSLMEVPFWRDGMRPEEYEIELAYYHGCLSDAAKRDSYVPLWRQKEQNLFTVIVLDEDWASPYMKEFPFWRSGMTMDEYMIAYKQYFETI